MRKINQVPFYLIVLLTITWLSGCGSKSDLYHAPETKNKPQIQNENENEQKTVANANEKQH